MVTTQEHIVHTLIHKCDSEIEYQLFSVLTSIVRGSSDCEPKIREYPFLDDDEKPERKVTKTTVPNENNVINPVIAIRRTSVTVAANDVVACGMERKKKTAGLRSVGKRARSPPPTHRRFGAWQRWGVPWSCATCHGVRDAEGRRGVGPRGASLLSVRRTRTVHRPFCCNVGSATLVQHRCFCIRILSENISKW